MNDEQSYSQKAEPDGFKVPVHRALTVLIMMAGLPREVAILLWTFAAAVVLGLHQLWFLVIGIATHLGLAKIAKGEPYMLEILKRVLKDTQRLEP